jgi:hypothetical protein
VEPVEQVVQQELRERLELLNNGTLEQQELGVSLTLQEIIQSTH